MSLCFGQATIESYTNKWSSIDSQPRKLNFTVASENKYLLWLVNTTLNNHFFAIENHSIMVVVANKNYLDMWFIYFLKTHN